MKMIMHGLLGRRTIMGRRALQGASRLGVTVTKIEMRPFGVSTHVHNVVRVNVKRGVTHHKEDALKRCLADPETQLARAYTSEKHKSQPSAKDPDRYALTTDQIHNATRSRRSVGGKTELRKMHSG
jgi:hypothetical protein